MGNVPEEKNVQKKRRGKVFLSSKDKCILKLYTSWEQIVWKYPREN
jgi:hypothetical protein